MNILGLYATYSERVFLKFESSGSFDPLTGRMAPFVLAVDLLTSLSRGYRPDLSGWPRFPVLRTGPRPTVGTQEVLSWMNKGDHVCLPANRTRKLTAGVLSTPPCSVLVPSSHSRIPSSPLAPSSSWRLLQTPTQCPPPPGNSSSFPNPLPSISTLAAAPV